MLAQQTTPVHIRHMSERAIWWVVGGSCGAAALCFFMFRHTPLIELPQRQTARGPLFLTAEIKGEDGRVAERFYQVRTEPFAVQQTK